MIIIIIITTTTTIMIIIIIRVDIEVASELIIFECAQTEVYPHINVWLVHCFVSKIVLLVNSHSN